MAKGILAWLHDVVIALSEKAVDKALSDDKREAVDFEILGNPDHPDFRDMQRRYNETLAREDRSDIE